MSDGGLKVYHPIPSGNFGSDVDEVLEERLEGHSSDLKVINGSRFLPQIYWMMNSYVDLLAEARWLTDANREVELKARFRRLGGTAVGFDYDEYVDYIENHGPPLNFEEVVELPRYRTEKVSTSEL